MEAPCLTLYGSARFSAMPSCGRPQSEHPSSLSFSLSAHQSVALPRISIPEILRVGRGCAVTVKQMSEIRGQEFVRGLTPSLLYRLDTLYSGQILLSRYLRADTGRT
ncbi:hypothetical protein JOB18_049722 [Solea senegalensis]|uniref:Uncharacterized protein n=1 Tax=Solea senegalensis TaxID=28829 RepID=A0AAV6RYX3_SOLSE|nr:hypothetical protein JOB18_049722 [Solea senegalensis]